MTPEERSALVESITAALKESHLTPQLSEEELQWVRLAIAAEARKIKFRDAIIEKTVGSLILLAITGTIGFIGYLINDFFHTHGFK